MNRDDPFGYSLALVDGDLVFDNLHPNGMPYDQWMRDFDAIGGIVVHSVTNF